MAIWTEVKLLFHVKRFSYDFCFYSSSLRKLKGLAGDMQTNKCQASYKTPLASGFSRETANSKLQFAVTRLSFKLPVFKS